MTKRFASNCSATLMERAHLVADNLLGLLQRIGLVAPPEPVSFDGLLDEVFGVWPPEAQERSPLIAAGRTQPYSAELALAA
jgi:hypothetical protein